MTDPQTLLEQAKCYLCLGVTMAEALQLALLAQVVDNTGGVSLGALVQKTNAAGNYTNATGSPALLVVVSSLQVAISDAAEMRICPTGQNNVSLASFRQDNEGNDQITANGTMTTLLAPGQEYTILNVAVSQVNTVVNHYQIPIL